MTPGAIHVGTDVRPLCPGVWVERASAASGIIVHATSARLLVDVAALLGFRASPKLRSTGIATTYFTAAKAERAIELLMARALPTLRGHTPEIANDTEGA